jgi:hypothetical protein
LEASLLEANIVHVAANAGMRFQLPSIGQVDGMRANIIDRRIVQELAPGALAIVMVGYAEGLGAAKAAAMSSRG